MPVKTSYSTRPSGRDCIDRFLSNVARGIDGCLRPIAAAEGAAAKVALLGLLHLLDRKDEARFVERIHSVECSGCPAARCFRSARTAWI